MEFVANKALIYEQILDSRSTLKQYKKKHRAALYKYFICKTRIKKSERQNWLIKSIYPTNAF